MKFRITRTTIFGDEQPIEVDGIYQSKVNNKILNKEIDKWYLEINSLEELIAFINECENDVVVSLPSGVYDDGCVEIEIYDGYRE